MPPGSALKLQPATNFTNQIWTHSPGAGSRVQGLADFAVSELRCQVPLRHQHPAGERIQLVGHMVYGESGPAASQSTRELRQPNDGLVADVAIPLKDRPIMLYLCGGPGADNPCCRVPDMNRWLLRKGYQILYMDYRGCGNSDPVTGRAMAKKRLGTDQEMAEYIKLFGQDNIVRDLEAVRLCLSEKLREKDRCRAWELKWTILGQSYGGYISLTYISTYPESLQEVFITGGLPPCGMTLDDYFLVKHSKLVKESQAFYTKYPKAQEELRAIFRLISDIGPENIRMTGRGYLTAQKLLTLGRQFGSKKGFREVYTLLTTIKAELEASQELDAKTIRAFEATLHIDERPLYALLLEQTWCSGGSTRWSAERIWRELPGFEYLRHDENGNYLDPSTFSDAQPIYFTSHVYGRFMYDTHEELIDFKGAAEILAEHEWECPYDYEKLARNTVPVYAVSFASDMHLDIDVAKNTAAKVGNMHLIVDEVNWHQDLRHRPAEILGGLFEMRDRAG